MVQIFTRTHGLVLHQNVDQAAADANPCRAQGRHHLQIIPRSQRRPADHGISLDSIQKLKEIEFKPPERKGDD